MLFKPNQKVVFIGDSITDYERARPVGEGLFGGIGKSYVGIVEGMVAAAYPDHHVRFVNMGIGGNTVLDLEARWQTDVTALDPDWVFVYIGINDVWRQFDSPLLTEQHVPIDEYEATYEKLIVETLKHAKGMILMTPFFMEPNKQDSMRAKMDEYGAVVRKLAEKYGLVFVDLQAAWDKLFEYMHPCNIAWDRIHPNQTGHMYIAKQFLAAVGAERC